MFNIQKCPESHEIYINYNEYISNEEDDAIPILEQMFAYDKTEQFKGIIDLITVKELSEQDILQIKEIHNVLMQNNIIKLNVISDSRKVIEKVKEIVPDVSVTYFKLKNYK